MLLCAIIQTLPKKCLDISQHGYISSHFGFIIYNCYHLGDQWEAMIIPFWPIRGQSRSRVWSITRAEVGNRPVAAKSRIWGLKFSVSHHSSHNILKIWLNPFYLAKIITNNIILGSQKVNDSLLFKKVFFFNFMEFLFFSSYKMSINLLTFPKLLVLISKWPV